MKESGYRALLLTEASAALAQLRQHRPDLILLDVHLGGDLNGWELLAALRQRPETAPIPVIMISADASALLMNVAQVPAPGVAVLEKPFRWAALEARLAQLLVREGSG